jgi:hypothetical protein
MDIGGRKGSGCVFIDRFLSIFPMFFEAFTVGTTSGVVQSEAMHSSSILFPIGMNRMSDKDCLSQTGISARGVPRFLSAGMAQGIEQ